MVRFDSLSPHDFLPRQGGFSKPQTAEKTPGFQEDSSERIQLILNLVKGHPDGVSASDIADALGIASNTVLKVLRELEREREVYSRTHSRGRSQVWYPNGRLIHPYLELFKEIRGKPYRISVQESRTGPLVQVQERSFSLLHGERVEGAIFVEYEALDQLIDGLNEMKTRYESHERLKVKQ